MEVNNKEPMTEQQLTGGDFTSLINRFPNAAPAQSYGFNALLVPAESWKELCSVLKNDAAYDFNMLVCISAVDREQEGIEIYAHVRSILRKQDMIVKCILLQELSQVDSLCEVWQSAELYEDEVYDLFGVNFTGHPFLRRLFLDDNFAGHPLRKDYGKVLER
ncbi:MAG: NADH-quinone oxidoreductase subunit C [Bacteroidales bacterium]